MKNNWIFIIPFIFFWNQLKAQFVSPLDSPLHLSGNFAALRSDHFHFGLDIPTNDTVGWPVKSVSKGYVSRVYISSSGYGLAVFVTHPSGHVSVYAHLLKFNAAITQWVRKKQYALQRNEVDLFPPKGLLQVKTGDIIAWSGNSGGSSGPHLHFEIRREKDNILLDPAHAFVTIQDTMPPRIDSMRFIPVHQGRAHWLSPYTVVGDTIKLPGGTYIPEALLYDLASFPQNKLTPRNWKTKLNGAPFTSCTFDAFGFHHSGSVIYHYNYPWYFHYGSKYTLLTWQPGLNAPFHQNYQRYLTISSGEIYTFELECQDVRHQTSSRKIYIQGIPEINYTNLQIIPWDTDTTLWDNNTALWWGKGTSSQGNNPYWVTLDSQKFLLSCDVFPFKKAAAIGCVLPEGKGWGIRSMNNQWIRSTHTKHGRTWFPVWKEGLYQLHMDTLPPTMTMLQKWQPEVGLPLKIVDDATIVNDGQGSGLYTYSAQLDGKWTLAYWDPKNGILTVLNDKTNPEGILQIRIKDKMGNSIEQVVEYR